MHCTIILCAKSLSNFENVGSHKLNRNKLGNLPNKVYGASDETFIANEFMKHFGSVYFDSNLEDEARVEYSNIVNDNQFAISPETNIDLVNVELYVYVV